MQGNWPTKFHLRVDPDGGGVLLANAAEAAYLSPVGVLMAKLLLEEQEPAALQAEVVRLFRGAAASRVRADIERVQALLHELAEPGDNYPITDLADPNSNELTRMLAAPVRADLAQCDAVVFRALLEKLWEVGVPHVTLHVDPYRPQGEIPRLIEAAEDIGLITGIRSLSTWLSVDTLDRAARSGLDHLDLLYAAEEAAAHDALAGDGDWRTTCEHFARAHELELCPAAQTPLLQANADRLLPMLESLQGQGITNVTVFALVCPDEDERSQAAGALPARALPQLGVDLTEAAEDTNSRFLWAPPVRFNPDRSLDVQVREGPRTAGDVAVRVDAGGRVYPPRGPATCAGSLLEDTWEEIWGNECFRRYRERLATNTRCSSCPDLGLCVADCIMDPAAWSSNGGAGEIS
jgi:radical SAM protein with 4Fe4S-binding SPASM domain